MPWQAAFTSTLLIPVKSITDQPTGEIEPDWDYSASEPIPCRIFDNSAVASQRFWGQDLRVDATAWVDISVDLPPLVLAGEPSDAQQVKVDGVKFMALRSRDLAHRGKIKAIALRRY